MGGPWLWPWGTRFNVLIASPTSKDVGHPTRRLEHWVLSVRSRKARRNSVLVACPSVLFGQGTSGHLRASRDWYLVVLCLVSAMLAGRGLRSSCPHKRGYGTQLNPIQFNSTRSDPTKVWNREFVAATDHGHTLLWDGGCFRLDQMGCSGTIITWGLHTACANGG